MADDDAIELVSRVEDDQPVPPLRSCSWNLAGCPCDLLVPDGRKKRAKVHGQFGWYRSNPETLASQPELRAALALQAKPPEPPEPAPPIDRESLTAKQRWALDNRDKMLASKKKWRDANRDHMHRYGRTQKRKESAAARRTRIETRLTTGPNPCRDGVRSPCPCAFTPDAKTQRRVHWNWIKSKGSYALMSSDTLAAAERARALEMKKVV